MSDAPKHTPGPKLTPVRIRVLKTLAAGEWLLHSTFYSAPPANPSTGLRQTRFRMRRRGLPYVTFSPLIAGGLVEERYDQFKRPEYRITDAGRAAIAKAEPTP